jgi:ankyrin repeat protein
LEVVRVLVAKGADVTAKANNGDTPLKLAASKANSKIVQFLTTKGAAQ